MSTISCNKYYINSSEISDESDVFSGLRKNWCCILEEIIECPICMNIPLSSIYQCTKGHSICDICRMLVINCPICQECFIGTRNRCVEEIVKKLEDIKSLILDPSSDVEKCSRIQKKSEGTQTEKISMTKNCIEPVFNDTPKLKQQKRLQRRKTL
ncbi:E3 ubiquitin-protein ligase sina-like [Chelonus insularis]|uniref:E3 ubiquitin-protein ligase sina-like n=1 Tax=Chelonus insularis TaxID=460826 RepID=UPI0015890388|nr:E3 ubiquitin-protein ligase sina-like [Chelonus insularis]